LVQELIGFTSILRQAGIPVSTGELLELLQAISLLEPTRENLLLAIRSTLVKESGHEKLVEELLDLYWLTLKQKVKKHSQNAEKNKTFITTHSPRLSRDEFNSRLAQMKEWLKQAMKSEDKSFSGGGKPAGQGAGNRKSAGKKESGNFQYGHLNSFMTGKQQPGPIPGEDIEQHNDKQPEMELLHTARKNNLYQRCFAELDSEQIKQVKKQVARLGRRLATRAGYRRIPAARGTVDMSRTVRLAATTGGIPLILRYQGRQLSRPDLVVLCDLSGSVAPYSQFMLLLVHTMQDKFRMVRSFAFVDAIAEITVHVKELDLENTIRNIQRQTGIWRTGFSDYGAVWRQFYHEYLHVLHRKVTLIILGDARNNYKPSGVEYFREICHQARQVIWLNPAPEQSWNREDSIMHIYMPYCRYVFECRNLSQLTRIARQIF
jgi:hypothetical protein